MSEEASEEEIKEEVIEETGEGGAREGEEASAEEYLPSEEEEEVTAPTAVDVSGLETMIKISDILLNTLRGSISDNEAIKKIKELRIGRAAERKRVKGRRRRRR